MDKIRYEKIVLINARSLQNEANFSQMTSKFLHDSYGEQNIAIF